MVASEAVGKYRRYLPPNQRLHLTPLRCAARVKLEPKLREGAKRLPEVAAYVDEYMRKFLTMP